jgi:tetratricopeptide (TPR) repeat protein
LADVRRDVLDRPTADRLAFMEGVFEDGAPGDRDGVRTLVAGAITARDAGHSDRALLLLSGAGRRCWWGDLGDVGRMVVETAHTLPVPPSDPRRLVIDAMAGTLAQGADVLARLPEWVVDPPSDPGSAALLATAAFNLADFDRALVFADRAVDVLRAQGRLSTVAQVQVTRAWAALYAGRWNDAYVAADEAYRLAVETRQPVWAAHARLGQADLEGRRGRAARALELIVDAERYSPTDPPRLAGWNTSAGSSSWAGSVHTRPTSTCDARWIRRIGRSIRSNGSGWWTVSPRRPRAVVTSTTPGRWSPCWNR